MALVTPVRLDTNGGDHSFIRISVNIRFAENSDNSGIRFPIRSQFVKVRAENRTTGEAQDKQFTQNRQTLQLFIWLSLATSDNLHAGPRLGPNLRARAILFSAPIMVPVGTQALQLRGR
jgi:hypothetical protein